MTIHLLGFCRGGHVLCIGWVCLQESKQSSRQEKRKLEHKSEPLWTTQRLRAVQGGLPKRDVIQATTPLSIIRSA